MAIMKNKAVVKLVLDDAKSKKAANKALMDIEGFSSYTLDLEKSTLVVMGDMDPIVLVRKLRKFVSADLVTFGPVKDEGPPPPQKPQQQKPQQQHGYGNVYGYPYN